MPRKRTRLIKDRIPKMNLKKDKIPSMNLIRDMIYRPRMNIPDDYGSDMIGKRRAMRSYNPRRHVKK